MRSLKTARHGLHQTHMWDDLHGMNILIGCRGPCVTRASQAGHVDANEISRPDRNRAFEGLAARMTDKADEADILLINLIAVRPLTMRFESTTKVLAECKLKYYRISECSWDGNDRAMRVEHETISSQEDAC